MRRAGGVNEVEKRWQSIARRLSRKVNAAAWLDQAAVPLVIAAGISAGALLWMRHALPENPVAIMAVASVVPVCAALGWAWRRARCRFIGLDEALVRLEVRHGMHAALSTARAGAGPWPPVPAAAGDGLRWRPARAGFPPVLAAALLAAAWLVPVTARTTAAPPAEPAAWNAIEADLRALVEERVVDESSASETLEAIEALRERPQGEWFRHSSIEAGDRLMLSHQREMAALESKMRDVARELRVAAEQDSQGADGGSPAGSSALNDMLNDLRAGALRPDEAMMERLAELAGENGIDLDHLDPDQLRELMDRLRENARRLAEMRELLPDLEEWQGACDGDCEGDGEGDGMMLLLADGGDDATGVPSDGPGEGGPVLGDDRDGPDADRREQLPPGDLSRAAPGDRLGETAATHDIDESESPALRAGGAPARPGDGGGAVWSDQLHPAEQEALRRFFE